MIRLISATGRSAINRIEAWRQQQPHPKTAILARLILSGGFALVVWLVLTMKSDEPNICSLEYRAAYLETHDSDAVLRRECPYEPWYRPGALEPSQKTGLCDMKYDWYRERWLQAVERFRAEKENYTDLQILGGYCPYDGSWTAQ